MIHSGGNDLLTRAGHHGSGEHIVGNTTGDLADHIGAGRGDEHHIRLLGKGYVFYAVLEIPVKGVYETLVGGQGFKSNGVNKISGISGHQHLHICVQLF